MDFGGIWWGNTMYFGGKARGRETYLWCILGLEIYGLWMAMDRTDEKHKTFGTWKPQPEIGPGGFFRWNFLHRSQGIFRRSATRCPVPDPPGDAPWVPASKPRRLKNSVKTHGFVSPPCFPSWNHHMFFLRFPCFPYLSHIPPIPALEERPRHSDWAGGAADASDTAAEAGGAGQTAARHWVLGVTTDTWR